MARFTVSFLSSRRRTFAGSRRASRRSATSASPAERIWPSPSRRSSLCSCSLGNVLPFHVHIRAQVFGLLAPVALLRGRRGACHRELVRALIVGVVVGRELSRRGAVSGLPRAIRAFAAQALFGRATRDVARVRGGLLRHDRDFVDGLEILRGAF